MTARIGIDLGTTNSLAAMVFDDGPQIIGIRKPEPCILPSVVAFSRAGNQAETKIGTEALRNIRDLKIRSIKRLMGRTYNEAIAEGAAKYFASTGISIQRGHGSDLVLKVTDSRNRTREFRPHDISSMILKEITDRASLDLGAPVEGSVITVPAYFRDTHRAATLASARGARISVIEPLLDEPTAAALAFGRLIGLASGEPLLVVDWGGGTLDVTVLVKDQTQWIQLNIDGDLNLGGDDLDEALLNVILERKAFPKELSDDPAIKDQLLSDTQTAKHVLSNRSEATLPPRLLAAPTGGGRVMFTTRVERNEAEECFRPFVKRVIDIVMRTVDHRDVAINDIKKVLLVGGSTKIPLLRKCLAEALPGRSFHDEVDPMHAVALGASIYASMQRPEVFRICPYGYSVESGDKAVTVIPPGQEIPTPSDLPYQIKPEPRTGYNGQTAFRLRLYTMTPDRRGLKALSKLHSARIFGREFPPSPAGTPIKVELWLDQNKEVRARAYPRGGGPAKELLVSMAELGDNALKTHLMDRALEARSYLEANRDRSMELLKELESAMLAADSALSASNHDAYSSCLDKLDRLMEVVRLPREPQSTKTIEEQTRERIGGWACFFEQDLLPRFWSVIDAEIREAALEDIRRIRIMIKTAASALELEKMHALLWNRLHSCKNSIIVRGYVEANTLGTSGSATDELDDLCYKAAEQIQQRDQAGLEKTSRLIAEKIQSNANLRSQWQQAEGIEHVNPDLIIPSADEE